MIKLTHLISLVLFLTISFTAYSQNSDYPITGMVVDANTSNPVSEATIIVSTGFGQNSIATDTFTTDRDGLINSTISLDGSAYGIAYTVSAVGYSSQSSYAMVDGDIISLDTIRLEAVQMDTTIVIGIIADSETNDAIEGATVTIASIQGAGSSKSASTDAQGFFTITFIYDKGAFTNYTYTVSAINYSNKSGSIQLNQDTVDLETIALTAIQSEILSINGVVVDRDNGEAIADATVAITAGDTTINLLTNSTGAFNADLEYDGATVTQISYSIDKFGYRETTGNASINGDSLDLDTIKLKASDLDTITVTAQVYYTDTETAVENADLLMYVTQGFNIESFDYNNSDIQTLSSNAEGIILGKIIKEAGGGSMGQLLAYALTLTDAESTEGTSWIIGDTIDLGTLYINEAGTPITFGNKINYNQVKPDLIQIFTINGKMIYEGKTFDINSIRKSGIVLNQQLLIVSRLKGKILSVSKRQLFK